MGIILNVVALLRPQRLVVAVRGNTQSKTEGSYAMTATDAATTTTTTTPAPNTTVADFLAQIPKDPTPEEKHEWALKLAEAFERRPDHRGVIFGRLVELDAEISNEDPALDYEDIPHEVMSIITARATLERFAGDRGELTARLQNIDAYLADYVSTSCQISEEMRVQAIGGDATLGGHTWWGRHYRHSLTSA